MAAVIAAMVSCLVAAPTQAEDRVVYNVALAGIPVGDIEIAVRRDGDRYDARLDGSYRVLFWSGALSSQAVGDVTLDGLKPRRFQSDSRNDRPSTTVIEFERAKGPVEWKRTPEAPAEWTEGRLPLEPAHLRSALDPISALAASALGAAGGGAPDVCDKAVRVFTGFVVFELDFQGASLSGQDRVTCGVIYRPLSGHRAESSSIERLSEPGVIDIAFDRLPSGVWFLSRLALPTRIGQLVVQRS